jgi:amino acid adenylation domain-containing protein/FkbM family methyltransferase
MKASRETQGGALWWRERLAPLPQESNLPLDHKRSKVYSAKRATVRFALPAEQSAVLHAAYGRTPERLTCALLAALAGVLHRYAGHRQIILGTPTPANAETPGAVAIPVTVEPDAPFSALLETTLESTRVSYENTGVPFAQVVEALGVSEVQNQNPLFNVALRLEGFHAPMPDVRTDVVVEVKAEGQGLSLAIDYSARLLQPETVERFGRHLVNLLAAGTATPQQPLARLPYLSTAEVQQLTREWNATTVDVGERRCVHELVAAQAARAPTAEAMFFEGRSYSYDWLNRRANKLAHHLRKLGAAPGRQVGLCVLPAPDMLVSLLAVLKTGAAVVPLDFTFPLYRIKFTVEDAQALVIVTESALVDRLPKEVPLLLLDREADAIAAQPDTDPETGVTGNDIVYILYTSGSTGRPKGVCMEHRSLTNLVHWQRQRSADPAGKRTLQRTSIAFDVGFQEVFSTWCFAGSLAVAPDEVRVDVSRLPAFISENQVARAFVPPVALYQLAESAATQRHPLSCLKEIIAAGEQLRITMPLVRFFRDVDCTLDNQYGPTETHVVTAHMLSGPSTRWPALPPIGKPIHNARIYLLDAQQQLVPAGVVGELFVGGTCVARGYLRRPELTASSFIPNPFSDEPTDRLYRTGDLGRYLPDGTIEYVGRRDHQVKVRGYRIELGEIEAVLLQAPGVREAAANVIEDESGDKRLAAYVVTREQDTPLSIIREFLQQRLPAHMVPSASSFVRLPALPLTSTGKVDRAKLPAPQRGRPEMIEAFAPTRSSVEEKVATLFCRALDLEQVGVHDGFFDLGGHSLIAIKLVSELNDLYGISVPLAALLRGGTVASIATLVEEMLRARAAPEEAKPAPASAPASGPAPTLRPVTLPGGLEVVSPHAAETEYLYTDVFEHRTYDRGGIRYPEKGGCIFDVGANIGLFTLYALQRAPTARVFAIEPAPPLLEALRLNTQAMQDRVALLDFGLSNRAGTAQLTYYPTLTGMSSLYPDRAEEKALLGNILKNLARGREGVQELLSHADEYIAERLVSTTYPCELRTLSQVIAETKVEVIDLLKIDVQKAELDVLEGIADEDWKRIRQVAVEVHDLGGRVKRISQLLENRGYRVKVEQVPLHAGTVVHFVYAT